MDVSSAEEWNGKCSSTVNRHHDHIWRNHGWIWGCRGATPRRHLRADGGGAAEPHRRPGRVPRRPGGGAGRPEVETYFSGVVAGTREALDRAVARAARHPLFRDGPEFAGELVVLCLGD